MIESVDGFRVGRKRRALSSACLFFRGLAVALVGGFYCYAPAESLDLIADAWDLAALERSGAAYVLARNLVMTAAVYLTVWGATCMMIATVSLPATKKAIAVLNLAAALVVSAASAFHPEAYACETCRVSVDRAIWCLKIALMWHAPLIALDVLAIVFADAGPRYIRLNDTTSVVLNGDHDGFRDTTITKINSHADLVKYNTKESTFPDEEGIYSGKKKSR